MLEPKVQMSCLIALEIDRKLTCTFKNGMMNLANFHRLKNNDFILESEMVELYQSKSSKEPHGSDTV